MASYLDFDGVYADGEEGRPLREFVINNWTDEDLHSMWNSKPILVKQGEVYQCGHSLAYKLTKELVDRELFKIAAKAATDKERERREMAVLSPDIRKPLEDKTLQEVRAGQENPVMAKMREEIRKEELAKLEPKVETGQEGAVVPKRSRKKAVEFEDAMQ